VSVDVAHALTKIAKLEIRVTTEIVVRRETMSRTILKRRAGATRAARVTLSVNRG
jgi:hypothetical protein